MTKNEGDFLLDIAKDITELRSLVLMGFARLGVSLKDWEETLKELRQRSNS